MKHQWAKVTAVVAVILLPFLLIAFITVFYIPPQFSNTFLAELSNKYERLRTVGSPKIIMVGGSNLAFGLDSKALEEYTGVPVVNFGLYASLGTKAMLDLSRCSVKRGDVVVVCPEIDSQTLSLYYNGKTMWQAIDNDYPLFFSAGFDNYGSLISAFFPFSAEKYGFFSRGEPPNPMGVYKKSSFDEYGDIIYERKYNNLLSGYDPNMIISFEPDIVGEGFFEYVNKYARRLRAKGAKVYFSFPPMNSLAIGNDTTDESILTFYRYLGENLDLEIISDINDYLLDWNYFFDTNFHLNSVGVQARTALLAADLLRAMGDKTPRQLSVVPPPIRPENYFLTNTQDDTTGFFLYEDAGGGLSISGISETGRREKTLILPCSFEGKPIVSLLPGVFAECDELTTVVIGENTNLLHVSDNTFSGCPGLRRIELHVPPGRFSVGLGFFGGTADSCKVHLSRDLYGDYATDYIWSQMMSRVTISG